MNRLRVITAVAFCMPVCAQDPIPGEPLGESIFGIKWTDTLDVVKAKFPDGEPSSLGNIRYWKVADFRLFFGIDRRERDFIQFGFIGPTLGLVTVSFPDCTVVAEALLKYSGQPVDSAILGVDVAKIGTWNGRSIRAHLLEGGGNCVANIGLN